MALSLAKVFRAEKRGRGPDALRRQTREVAALYLAASLDPHQSTIFVQSHVRAHAECCWILNWVTPVGWLERMTQFKAKAAQRESVGTGLLDYPVLQAADILLYDADEVPVGEDQKQHVELARDIAQRFNHLYGETFTLPRAAVPPSGARVRAFNDPTSSVSDPRAMATSSRTTDLIGRPLCFQRVKLLFHFIEVIRQLDMRVAAPPVIKLIQHVR
jgi:tryptophanyl-tRNA synthetase